MSARTCAACGARCYFHDTHWVCDRCGSEWDTDHDSVQYVNPVELDPQAIERIARREWSCTCVDGPNSRSRSTRCTAVIRRGDAYVEYVGEAGGYSSGTRYCLACGTETWRAT